MSSKASTEGYSDAGGGGGIISMVLGPKGKDNLQAGEQASMKAP